MPIKRFDESTPKSICWIKQHDLVDLSILLTKGYPVSSALRIVDSRYEPLLLEIEQGKNLIDFIDFKKKNDFFQSLQFFLTVSPFEQAVQSAHEYFTMKQNFKKQWFKQTAYPTFIFLFAFVLFVLFENVLYPQLSTFIEVEKTFPFHKILYITLNAMGFLVVVSVLGIAFLIKFSSKKEKIFTIFYDRYLIHFSLFKKIISFELATKMHLLMKRGFSTQEMFNCLRTLKGNPFLNYCLNEMIQQCEQGIDLPTIFENQKHLDHKFQYFVKMGLYAQHLETSLHDYCEYQQKQFIQQIKKASVLVSAIAYSFIMLLVITIYQILLIPLDLINQM